MSQIHKSIHGREFGLSHTGKLIMPAGTLIGPHGAQRTLGSLQEVALFDDFLGDLIADEWNNHNGANGSLVAVAINAQAGGVIRMVTGSAPSGTFAQNGVLLDSELNWTAAGGLVIDAAVKVSAITAMSLFVGFTDQKSSLEQPFSLTTADALTSNATDAVGFLFDTNADTDHIFLVGVKGDTDATSQPLAVDPATASFTKFRIEIDATGAATFYINGAQVGTKMANALTTTVKLTPVICATSNASGAIINVDVDYISVSMPRP